MFDGPVQRQYMACAQLQVLPYHVKPQCALQDVNGNAPIIVVLMHLCAGLHGDQYDAEVGSLQEGF
jgi:hypothetical protein